MLLVLPLSGLLAEVLLKTNPWPTSSTSCNTFASQRWRASELKKKCQCRCFGCISPCFLRAIPHFLWRDHDHHKRHWPQTTSRSNPCQGARLVLIIIGGPPARWGPLTHQSTECFRAFWCHSTCICRPRRDRLIVLAMSVNYSFRCSFRQKKIEFDVVWCMGSRALSCNCPFSVGGRVIQNISWLLHTFTKKTAR